VFLFRGRLSYHAKANPTPMYQALQAAATASGRSLHLIHHGWFANEGIHQSFTAAAQALCPAVRCHFVDGRAPDDDDNGVFYAADVFTSLSDNIQETFGITPLEAMASGLPVVVSDWDGYRDTVRNGVDGFTIPTLGSPPGAGEDLASCYAADALDYDGYVGNASLATSVDTAACSQAYLQLILNQALRRRMGEAGQRRARLDYDWRHIIRRYQELWRQLGAIRRSSAAREQVPRRPERSADPTRPDPFRYCGSFPTRALHLHDEVSSAVPDLAGAYRRVSELTMNNWGTAAVGVEVVRDAILDLVHDLEPCTVAALLERVPPAGRPQLSRVLVWLAKLGLIEVGGHNRPGNLTPSRDLSDDRRSD
jgi:hypothetical protein